MRILKDIINGDASRTAVIKEKAHLFTLLSVIWSGFSLFGLLMFRENQENDHWIGLTPIFIWILHAALIVLSIYFWITERPKPVLVFGS